MRKKIKKMTFDELADNFEVVSEQEQAFYVGRARFYFDSQGRLTSFVDDGTWQQGFETIIVNGHEKQQPFGTYNSMRNNTAIDSGAAKGMFAHFAQYTTVEWGMAIQGNGTAIVFTNHHAYKIGTLVSGNTTIIVHSHPSCCDVSDEDMMFAENNPHYAHFIWYNGQFRQFYEFGWMGDWRPNLFLW